MNIRLQKATGDDWKAISDLMEKAESRTFHATIGEDAVRKFIDKDEVFLILSDEKVAGLIAYGPQENSNYLSELVVSHDHQGKGIATEAIKTLISQVNNKLWELHTHPENQPAIKAYWKLGFQIKDWVNNYLGEGEPRLLLVRN